MLETNFNTLCNDLGKFAQSQFPLEACGIITKDYKFFPSVNLSNRPRVSFMIDPLLLITHDTNIWGVFHSHPDERFTTPSEQDLKLLVYDSLKFILYVDNKFYIYWYDRDKNIKRYEIFNASHIENS